MKKILCLLLALLLTTSLVACSQNNPDDNNSTNINTENTVTTKPEAIDHNIELSLNNSKVTVEIKNCIAEVLKTSADSIVFNFGEEYTIQIKEFDTASLEEVPERKFEQWTCYKTGEQNYIYVYKNPDASNCALVASGNDADMMQKILYSFEVSAWNNK